MKKKIGIFTLAISLITLGVLFLLNNFLDFNVYKVMSIIWPCIIILFGLEMIIVRQIYKRREEDANISIDSLSIILLVVIVFVFSIVSNVGNAFSRVDFLKDGFHISPNFNVLYKYNSSFSKDYEFEGNGKDDIILKNAFGDIEIKKSNGDKIEFSAIINMNHNDEKLAEEISNKVVKIDETGSTLSIKSDIDSYLRDRDKVGDISVDYYVKVPNTVSVDVENSFGNIYVEDIGKEANISNSYGEITVKSIDEKLNVDSSFGEITIVDVGGDTEVNNSHGNIKVSNIKGDLNLTNSFGNIEISEASKFVKIISHNGEIIFESTAEIEKGLEIDNEFGEINISLPSEQEGKFSIVTDFGDISNDFGLTVNEDITEQSINESIGDNEVKINIRNTNGNIGLDAN